MQTDDAARAARVALDRLLDAEAPALRSGLPPGFADAAEHYVRLLLEANDRLNLTRVVDPEAVARLHLLDALAALPHLDAAGPHRALDIGTGAGVPGLVLALARPSVRWTLVDSVGKKVHAVRGFLEALGLSSGTAVQARAEDLGRGDLRDTQDLVVARACAPLPVLAEYALPLLRPGGVVLAWKGPIGTAELAAGAAASRLLGGRPPEVRPTGIAALGDHRFVLIPKVTFTPTRYPRRPGEPARRPLA